MKRVFGLLVVAGIVTAAVKMMAAQKKQWEGLTESEARAKLDAKLPKKLAGEKRAEVTDKVIGAMKEKGALAADEAPAGGTG